MSQELAKLKDKVKIWTYTTLPSPRDTAVLWLCQDLDIHQVAGRLRE